MVEADRYHCSRTIVQFGGLADPHDRRRPVLPESRRIRLLLRKALLSADQRVFAEEVGEILLAEHVALHMTLDIPLREHVFAVAG